MSRERFALMRRNTIQVIIVGLMALAIAGCGRDVGDVRGRVTMDGEPLQNTVIYFQSANSPLAQSSLDNNGKYHLTTPGLGNGAAPGSYRVYLMAMPSEEAEMAKSAIRESDLISGKPAPKNAEPPIPAKASRYYSAETTDWHRNVVSGSNEFDFELVTK